MIQDKRPGQGGGKPPEPGPPLSTSSVSTGQSDRTATKAGQDWSLTLPKPIFDKCAKMLKSQVDPAWKGDQ